MKTALFLTLSSSILASPSLFAAGALDASRDLHASHLPRFERVYACDNGLEATVLQPLQDPSVYQLKYAVYMDDNEDWIGERIVARFSSTLRKVGSRFEGRMSATVSCRQDSKTLPRLEETVLEFGRGRETIRLTMPLVSGKYFVKPTKNGYLSYVEPQWDTLAWAADVDAVTCKAKH